MKDLFREREKCAQSPDRRAVLTGSLASIAVVATPSAKATPHDPLPDLAQRYKTACQHYRELEIPKSASFTEEEALLRPYGDAVTTTYQQLVNTPAPTLTGITTKLRLFLEEMQFAGKLDPEFDLIASALKDCEFQSVT
ncbi:hypothetical protein PsW64_05283 [Pseudovibrio sp. W64]|uniref:hypothetical protein n=1 Tax=Pseudovibrio sp. W64 TaxID=1735583 RepID=UPI0007AEA585|nr:hypothetical protein [Pseudovibrio sp. W64]KZK75379.1 hypothetical protein PsW64_05283 [Pseudovibrio sp. W64]